MYTGFLYVGDELDTGFLYVGDELDSPSHITMSFITMIECISEIHGNQVENKSECHGPSLELALSIHNGIVQNLGFRRTAREATSFSSQGT